MLETASLMAEKNGEIQFVVALAATRTMSEIEAAKRQSSYLPKNLIVVQDETREALNAADAAAVASGTATLETAIIGTPMAIVYKTSPFNYKLLRPLISVEHFGLINLIAEERLATELIQADFTKKTLAKELFRLLEKEENQKMRERLSEVTDTLGHGGASKRAAGFVLSFLESEVETK
jgi:lipid-A-disaccharide synthase